MSEYFKLKDMDTLIKKDGDMAFIFDCKANEWVRDKNQILKGKFDEQDGEHMVDCELLSENEARAWIARKADRAE